MPTTDARESAGLLVPKIKVKVEALTALWVYFTEKLPHFCKNPRKSNYP
jgi:hypothetical protein